MVIKKTFVLSDVLNIMVDKGSLLDWVVVVVCEIYWNLKLECAYKDTSPPPIPPNRHCIEVKKQNMSMYRIEQWVLLSLFL